MELQTGDLPCWERSPVAFTETGRVSQFATFTTTWVSRPAWPHDLVQEGSGTIFVQPCLENSCSGALLSGST